MKTFVVKFFAGSGIRLAVLSVLLLGMAGSCMAQASAAPASPAAKAAAAPQAQPVAQPGQAAAPGKPAPKGASEGIKVHGHWTIEVRNPDGTLVTHREFENGLSSFNGPNNLVSVLSGVTTPGNWGIVLSGGACSRGTNGICLILPPSASTLAAGYGTGACSTSLASASPQPWCYETLTESLTAPAGTPLATQFVLAGYAYVDTSTTLTGVGTDLYFCLNNPSVQITPGTLVSPSSISPATCSGMTGDSQWLTSRNLDGLNGDPAAVPVTAGQTVAVTVQISFSSN